MSLMLIEMMKSLVSKQLQLQLGRWRGIFKDENFLFLKNVI